MLTEFLTPDRIIPRIKARCKREALSALADKASISTAFSREQILDTLLEREKLGSTGVGEGVAIPHGKLEGLDGIIGFLGRLEKPVDFDAVDDAPVDLMFLLLAPCDASAAHLKALAQVSRLLRDPDLRKALRGAESADAIYAVATANPSTRAA